MVSNTKENRGSPTKGLDNNKENVPLSILNKATDIDKCQNENEKRPLQLVQ